MPQPEVTPNLRAAKTCTLCGASRNEDDDLCSSLRCVNPSYDRDTKDAAKRDLDCFNKAVSRGQLTFSVVAQDVTAPETIAEWIKLNIRTAPAEKLLEALQAAILCRQYPRTKHAD